MQTFDKDLVGKVQSVSDEYELLNPHTIPLIKMIGFSEPVYNTTHEWVEDEMFTYEALVTTELTAEATEVVVDDAEPFAKGQVAKIGDELVLVTNVLPGEKKLTVQRGYADTTAAIAPVKSVIEVLFNEGEEGADYREARNKKRKTVSNKTQIFSDSIEITGSALEVHQYNIVDFYDSERAKKQIETALQLEKAIINGVGFDNGSVRQMKGIRQYIVTNVIDAAGAAVTLDHINDLAERIYKKGGFATGGNYVLIAGPKQKRALGTLDSAKVNIPQGSSVRGDVVDGIITDFGQFPVALNNNLASDEILLIDINRIDVKPLGKRVFSHTFHGQNRDGVSGTVLGEYTLEFRQEKAHGRIKGLK